ncbi:MAG: ComEA family DNA-binding protein [Ruminiclostridium sp.]
MKIKESLRFPIIAAAYLALCVLIFIFTDLPGFTAYVEAKPIVTEAPAEEELPQKEKLININTATAEELMTIDGIGEATAAKIIEYRKKNNGFLDIDELQNVSGIGVAKLEKIRNFVTI